MTLRRPALSILAATLCFAASAAVADQTLNPLRAIEKSSLDGFLGRPLFAPSRRTPAPPAEAPMVAEAAPEAAAVEATPAPPPGPPRLRLTGVLTAGGAAVAVVTNLDTNAVESLHLGDMLDGWLVTAIEPIALRMTLDDRDEEFKLFERKAGP